ncbi:hypothetical protein MED193_06309 [Roseobacter sp. MED193]|nr:hypothetical protein MED193_06309 [Roseobacter sp. MED193]
MERPLIFQGLALALLDTMARKQTLRGLRLLMVFGCAEIAIVKLTPMKAYTPLNFYMRGERSGRKSL